MRLNAAQLAALYALRGTVRRHGELELGQSPGGALFVRHPDGRVWGVDEDGSTVVLHAAREAVPGGC